MFVKKRIINILHVKLMLNLEYVTYQNILIENQPCLSRVIEMRITLISSYRHIIYVYYKKKQKLTMCEIKLNQFLYKIPPLINSLSRSIIYPFI